MCLPKKLSSLVFDDEKITIHTTRHWTNNAHLLLLTYDNIILITAQPTYS